MTANRSFVILNGAKDLFIMPTNHTLLIPQVSEKN